MVFSFGTTTLGTATLAPGTGNSSTATLITSTLPVGTDTVTVTYAATTDFGAAGASTTITIGPSLAGSFSLTVTPATVQAGVGYATALTITVVPQNGFSQAVNLSCGALPYETTCAFLNTSIANGSGTTTLFVIPTAPHDCGGTQPYFLGRLRGGAGRVVGRASHMAPLAAPALAGLVMLFVPGRGRRRLLRMLVVVVAAAAAMQMMGCGHCTDLGTRPATYTFQVTGTAAGSGEAQSQTVTLNVVVQ